MYTHPYAYTSSDRQVTVGRRTERRKKRFCQKQNKSEKCDQNEILSKKKPKKTSS